MKAWILGCTSAVLLAALGVLIVRSERRSHDLREMARQQEVHDNECRTVADVALGTLEDSQMDSALDLRRRAVGTMEIALDACFARDPEHRRDPKSMLEPLLESPPPRRIRDLARVLRDGWEKSPIGGMWRGAVPELDQQRSEPAAPLDERAP